MVKKQLKIENQDVCWTTPDYQTARLIAQTKAKTDSSYNVSWSEEDDGFICQGKKYPDIAGIGETEAEAVKVYYELLEEYLKDNKVSKLAGHKGGRPKKSNAKLVYNVPHGIKAFIELEAARNEVNQGAIVEKIVKFYQESNKEELSRYYDLL
jgi:hypothetical protein